MKRETKFSIGFLLVFAIVIVIFVITEYGGRAPMPTVAAPAPTPAPITKPAEKPVATLIVTHAEHLYAEYDANEARANSKYKGQILRVGGVVSSVEEHELFGGYTISLRTGNQFAWVYCKTEDASFAKEVSQGDRITVEGIGDGAFLGSPFIEQCGRVFTHAPQ